MPTSRRLILVGGALATTLWASSASAGELRKADDDVHGKSSGASSSSSSSSSASSSDSSSSSSSSSSDDDSSSSGSGWGIIFGYVLLAPFFVPHMAVEEDAPSSWSMLPRPYYSGASGYMARVVNAGDDPDTTPPGYVVSRPEQYRTTSAQVALEGLIPVSGVGRLQLSARLLTVYRLELDAAYGVYLEKTTRSGSDSAWLGSAHAAFRFAQGEHVQFRGGLGMRQWIDPTGSTFGFDGLYAIDIFWGRPMTTAIAFSGGSLGQAWVYEMRGTVGATLGFGELYAGYDALWIGPDNGSSSPAYLGGPVAGIRAYF